MDRIGYEPSDEGEEEEQEKDGESRFGGSEGGELRARGGEQSVEVGGSHW